MVSPNKKGGKPETIRQSPKLKTGCALTYLRIESARDGLPLDRKNPEEK